VLAKILCLLISKSQIAFVNFTVDTQLLASPVEIGMLNVVTLLNVKLCSMLYKYVPLSVMLCKWLES